MTEIRGRSSRGWWLRVVFAAAVALLVMGIGPQAAWPGEAHASGGYVVTTLDDDGTGSLREAITLANADEGADTITFSVTGTITLLSQLPAIDDTLTISGPGAANLTISGNNAHQVFVVNAGKSLTLEGVTIANGNAGGGDGGGIDNSGTLTVTNSTFAGNSAGGHPLSGWHASNGGGIDNSGTLTVTNSTFAGNSASNGGGIHNSGTLTVTNSTFAGNSATYDGGGIDNSGTLTVTNSTFSGNSASYGGGIANFGWANPSTTVTNSTFSGNSATYGGGIANFGWANPSTTVTNSTFSGNSASLGGSISSWGAPTVTLTVTNTILANSTGGDCYAETIASNVNNLIGDESCNAVASGNVTGFLSGDPLLGPLADNGGPTHTMALLPDSPAINAGTNTDCPATDQRGITRLKTEADRCDIGAFEYQPSTTASPPTATVVLQAASDTGASNSDNLTRASSLVFDVTFSTAVTGLTASDFSRGGTATKCKVQAPVGSGSAYTVEVTGCTQGTVILTLGADSVVDGDDTAGPEAAVSATVTIDRTAPAVVSFTRTTLPATFTLTFTEAVTGLTASDFVVTGKAKGCVVEDANIMAVSGAVYTVQVTGCTSGGSLTLTLKASTVADLAGNAGPLKPAAVTVTVP
jgi:hypothetical protein